MNGYTVVMAIITTYAKNSVVYFLFIINLEHDHYVNTIMMANSLTLYLSLSLSLSIYIYIYIYIYHIIVIHRRTVSIYQNSSVWLDA